MEDSEVFPLSPFGHEDGDDRVAVAPSPLQPPPLSSVVKLAKTLAEKDRESALDAGELTRHLAASLGAGEDSVARYLVAWAARLGWRDPWASVRLLECLVSAKAPMRWEKFAVLVPSALCM